MVDEPSFSFAAGQYINVVHPSGERIPFSIATPPYQLPNLALHFQPTTGNPHADLMRELLSQKTLTLEGPGGGTSIDKATHGNLLFVCAGSGFAQAAAMLGQALIEDQPRRMTILWCCETANSVYAAERFFDLGSSVSKHLCIDSNRSGTNAGFRWLKRHANQLVTDCDRFLCGSPRFVWSATDLLIEVGVDRARMHSDVYDYAPRP